MHSRDWVETFFVLLVIVSILISFHFVHLFFNLLLASSRPLQLYIVLLYFVEKQKQNAVEHKRRKWQQENTYIKDGDIIFNKNNNNSSNKKRNLDVDFLDSLIDSTERMFSRVFLLLFCRFIFKLNKTIYI